MRRPIRDLIEKARAKPRRSRGFRGTYFTKERRRAGFKSKAEAEKAAEEIEAILQEFSDEERFEILRAWFEVALGSHKAM